MTNTQTLNDASLNGYNGLSMFNSMANEDMTIFFQNFGMMGWQSGNRYTYAESSPVTNTFVNLKYLISRDGSYKNTYDLTNTYQIGGVTLLKNEHYLPMGFMVNSDLLKWQVNKNEDQFNPFDQQNEFFKLATGVSENVYDKLEVVSQGHTDYSQFPVNKTSYGNYSYNCTDTTTTPHLKWNYTAPYTGYVYVYADIDGKDDVTLMINDDAANTTNLGMSRPYIACGGYVNEGDKISVYAELPQGQAGNAHVYVNMLNQNVFEQGYANISKDVMTTTELTGSSMKGTINASKDGLFYTSIPNEEGGWKAYVDGKEVNITPVGDALIAFNLSQGEHNIELVYYPKGFKPGAVASAICVLGFAAICAYVYIIKKKKGETVAKEVTPVTTAPPAKAKKAKSKKK